MFPQNLFITTTENLYIGYEEYFHVNSNVRNCRNISLISGVIDVSTFLAVLQRQRFVDADVILNGWSSVPIHYITSAVTSPLKHVKR